ncbi:hypothetical protein HMI51_25180 [Corallococcus coralloides]|nr:hypothetical protein [Corallococcus coralloides]
MRASGSTPGMPLMPRRVVEAYVRAEVASFPLVSMTAFESAMVQLNPNLDKGERQPNRTLGLWRECERTLSEHASGWSLDRLVLARDFFWFGDAPGRRRASTQRHVSMRLYLTNLARGFLKSRPGITWLEWRSDANAFDASSHYRWLTFALPEDLLLAAIPEEPPPVEVRLESPPLMQSLEDAGVAEIHQHIGASMDFPLLWASLLAELADPMLQETAAESPALPIKDGKLLLRWLLAAAIARCVLAEYMISRHTGCRFKTFQEFMDERSGFRVWPGTHLYILARTLQALARGDSEQLPAFHALHGLYMALHPVGSTLPAQRPQTLREVWQLCDPIAVRLNLDDPNGGERWLMRHGMNYLGESEKEPLEDRTDVLFSRIFWQALRVRCIYYRTVVQRPMTAGLQWFVRFSDRLGWAREPLRDVRSEMSFRVAGRGRPLRALEARITPWDTSFDLARDLLSLTHSWRQVIGHSKDPSPGQREPEFGVIIHFVKERDPDKRWASGAPPAGQRQTFAEPHPREGIRMGGRYADYFAKQVVKARALVKLLRDVPLVLWLLRGLDVASVELGVPTWVLVPIYHHIHWEANVAATTPAAMHHGQHPPPLRLTAHVGEDFRHLMEGLRRIFECLQYLMVASGGRLGHATALGIEPRLWAESTGSVMMTAEDRLWDLVFEWRLYSSYRIPPDLRAEAPPGRPEQVENAIRELAANVFGGRHGYEPPVLAETHHVLHRLMCQPEAHVEEGTLDGFNHAVERLNDEEVRNLSRVRRLLRAYREDEQVFQRGQEPVDITLDDSELAALYAVQNALRRAVSMRQVVVEVNPSSNLLIGDMMDLRNHPILRLHPPEPQGSVPPVPIAVSSDDPIVFSTWLMHEYELIFEAALTAGYPERCVTEWLDKIRRTGLDGRFTVAWLPRASTLAEELECKLHEYLHNWIPSARRVRGDCQSARQ